MWPIKNFVKYFMAHQYIPKIFNDPHKNPPAHPSNILNVWFLISAQIYYFLLYSLIIHFYHFFFLVFAVLHLASSSIERSSSVVVTRWKSFLLNFSLKSLLALPITWQDWIQNPTLWTLNMLYFLTIQARHLFCLLTNGIRFGSCMK